jgi:hypothetical protein
MGNSDKNRFEGSLVTIPTDAGIGLAKILFVPAREKNVGLFKIFRKAVPSGAAISQADFNGEFELRYARLQALKDGAWSVLAKQAPDPNDYQLTKRIVGSEIFVGDQHIGSASEADEQSVPQMLSYGERLIEKFIVGFAA